MDYLKKHARKLYENGYKIVPIARGKKFPPFDGWQKVKTTPNNIKKWWNIESLTGVGLLCEYVVSVDIDIRDPEVVNDVVAKLEEIVGTTDLIRRVGFAPKLLIPFRIVDEESKFHKIQSSVYTDWMGVEHKLEILGKGNQCVAYHIHPDTNEPYKYLTDKDFLNTKYDDLPTLTAFQAKQLVDWFESDVVTALEWEKKPTAGNTQKGKLREALVSDDPLDNIVPPLEISDFKVVKTLEAIDANTDMESWVKVGFALYHQYNGSDLGLQLFKTWSATSDNEKHQKNIKRIKTRWTSFEAEISHVKPVTFAYPLELAKDIEDADEIEELRELLPEIPEDDEEDQPSNDSDDDKALEKSEVEKISSWVKPKLGTKQRKKLDRYIARYTYVVSGKAVIDNSHPIHIKEILLDEFHQSKVNEYIEVGKPMKSDPDNTAIVPLSQLWQKSLDRENVHAIIYSPGQKRYFRDEHKMRYANSFHYPDHKRAAKKMKVNYNGTDRLDVFFKHMEYLFACEKERKWFMQWLAFTIQKPSRRCQIMPIHISLMEGTGRSWLVKLISPLLGVWNVQSPEIAQLIGQKSDFNDHLVDCKVVCCEEVRTEGRDRYKVENVLKSDITDLTKLIRRKHGTQKTEKLFGNFLGFSNYHDCIQISDDARRYNFFSGPKQLMNKAYYDRLYDWADVEEENKDATDANIAQLFGYLESYDISDFDMSVPMDTPARRRVISSSKSDTEAMIDSLIRVSEHRVMTANDVRDEIAEREKVDFEDPALAANKIKGVLRQKAYELGRKRAGTAQYRLWSLDGEMSNEDVSTQYLAYLASKDGKEFE